MKCLWPGMNSKTCRTLAVAFPLALSAALAWSSIALPLSIAPNHPALANLENDLGRASAHISEFSPVSSPLALPKCENVRAPEALHTPDPLPHLETDDLIVRVSFIVGTDGHVHSAFVLESGGYHEDQIVLRAIHHWRYRPALCNGVPTDSEARVRFSLHERANSPTITR